jgi:hypothetical protein
MADSTQTLAVVVAHAHRLIDDGWSVFPARVFLGDSGKTEKQPLNDHGHRSATNDKELIRQQLAEAWERLKDGEDLVLGAAPGPSGRCVIDVDVKVSDTAGFVILDSEIGRSEHFVETPSGGEHHIYLRRDQQHVGNRTPRHWRGLVDLRCDNGWIVAPGSVTRFGSYVERGGPGDEVMVRPELWPELVSEDYERHELATEVPAEWLTPGEPCRFVQRHVDALAAARPGERHHTMLSEVLAVLGAGQRGHEGAKAGMESMRAWYVEQKPEPRPGYAFDLAARGAVQLVRSRGDLHDRCTGPTCEGDDDGWLVDNMAESSHDDRSDTGTTSMDGSSLDGSGVPDAFVEHRLRQLRADREARRILAEEDAEQTWAAKQIPPVMTAVDLLNSADEDSEWLIDGMQRRGSKLLIEAQYKTGKSTLTLKLAERLVTGEPFLEYAEVEQLADDEAVVLIDTELGSELRAFVDQHVDSAAMKQIMVVNLRGTTGSVDVRSETVRREFAQWIRAEAARLGLRPAYLIVDVASPWISSLGIDENSSTEVRGFLEGLDSLRLLMGAEAGIAVTHHMGHTEKRGRGSSAWRDWPSAIWTITRQNEDMASQRFIQVFGRDVSLPQTPLILTAPSTATGVTTLSLGTIGQSSGVVSHEQQARQREQTKRQKLLTWFAERGKDDPDRWHSLKALKVAGNAGGPGVRRGLDELLAELVDDGLLERHEDGTAILHRATVALIDK